MGNGDFLSCSYHPISYYPTIKELCDRAVCIENGVTQLEGGNTEAVLKACGQFLNGQRVSPQHVQSIQKHALRSFLNI